MVEEEIWCIVVTCKAENIKQSCGAAVEKVVRMTHWILERTRGDRARL